MTVESWNVTTINWHFKQNNMMAFYRCAILSGFSVFLVLTGKSMLFLLYEVQCNFQTLCRFAVKEHLTPKLDRHDCAPCLNIVGPLLVQTSCEILVKLLPIILAIYPQIWHGVWNWKFSTKIRGSNSNSRGPSKCKTQHFGKLLPGSCCTC